MPIRAVERYGILVFFFVAMALASCRAKAPVQPPELEVTPVPTVPLTAPTPPPTAVPIPTRRIGRAVESRDGAPIGPRISHFGVGRADGLPIEPTSVGKDGIPTYTTRAGSGFMIIVEAMPGESGLDVGRRVFVHLPDDPAVRPDLEIQATSPLGNGSKEVCDRWRPKIGGIPAIDPPSFALTQKVTDTLNDFSCRFETFSESEFSCTVTRSGDFSFASPDTTAQFCIIIARAYGFPVGDTLLSVRVRDVAGNPGPVSKLRIHRPRPKTPGSKK